MFAFPDMNKSFNMYTTLVEEFVNKGYEVTVVAPGKEKTGINLENGIPVLRVRTLPIKNVPNYLKGISNVFLPYQFERALNKFYKKKSFDFIVSPTPPITLVGLAAKLKRRHNAKFYLILRDIFPQNAVDLGFIKEKGLPHLYFSQLERKLYKEADFIGCMSKGNIDFVMKHNPEVSPMKLHELKNFQKAHKCLDLNPEFIKKKYRIENKFVVVFGGNMGKPQQLENVLALAESVVQFSDILFLLLGEGVQMNRIETLAKEKELNNIRILRTLHKLEYQDLLSVCDIGLISLHKDFTIPNIPSKALDYFNLGIPILASLDKATDFGEILDKNNCGLWCYAGEIQEFKKMLLRFYNEPKLKQTMGRNANIYFEKYLTPEIACNTILSKISQ